MAAIYAARGNGSAEEFAGMMTAETWLDGDEAVAAGLADRTIGDDASEPAAFLYELYQHTPDQLKARHRDRLAESVHHVSAAFGRELAAHAAATPEKEIEPMTDNTQGNAAPEITLESLERDNPDVAAQIRADAARAERERLAGIDAAMFPGQEDIAAKLKADGTTTPAQAALIFNKAEKAKGSKIMADVKAASDDLDELGLGAAPTDDGTVADPVASLPEGEEKWRAEWEHDPKVRAEFTSERRYLAYRKAEAAGRVKILGKTAA